MNPISNTAFYCCGIRMRDAERRRPICGDNYAKVFMDERGIAIFRRFGGESGPNVGNVARHRYIDDYLRDQLAKDPKLRIVLLGCGFDSRAFRLQGGEWIELDEPHLIAYKNKKLPANRCVNRLKRVSIDFAKDDLAKVVAFLPPDRPTIFVIEGVTMYLTAAAMKSTLVTLKRLFASHHIICDLMNRDFLERYGRSIKAIIEELGAYLIPLTDPAEPFVRVGYRQVSSESILVMSLKYQRLGMLSPLLHVLAPGGTSGYTVRVFVPGK